MDNTPQQLDIQPVVEKVTKLREDMYDLLQRITAISHVSAETKLALRSIQMSRGWLGKIKGILTGMPGYKVVDSIANIPANTDVKGQPEKMLRKTDEQHLQEVNAIRSSIKSFVEQLNILAYEASQFFTVVIAMKPLIELEECSMWLGYELQRLKEQYDREVNTGETLTRGF